MVYNFIAEFLLNSALHSSICFGTAALIDKNFAYGPRVGLYLWNVAALACLVGLSFHYIPIIGQPPLCLNRSYSTTVWGSFRASWCIATLITWVWMLGALFCLLRLTIHARCLYTRLKTRAPLDCARTAALLEQSKRDLEFRGPLTLSTHPELGSPVAIGKREICIPPQAQHLPKDQLLAVLGHEICHLQRLDSFKLPILELLCAIFWFQPLARTFVTARDRFVEQICDQSGSHSAGTPRAMAEALLSIASSSPKRGILMPSLGQRGISLTQRIARLVEDPSPPRSSTLFRRVCLLACLGAMLAVQTSAPNITMQWTSLHSCDDSESRMAPQS